MTTACGDCTSTVITVSENPNNVQMNTTFTATIAAVNLCGETGPTGTASYTLSKLPLLNEKEHQFDKWINHPVIYTNIASVHKPSTHIRPSTLFPHTCIIMFTLKI